MFVNDILGGGDSMFVDRVESISKRRKLRQAMEDYRTGSAAYNEAVENIMSEAV